MIKNPFAALFSRLIAASSSACDEMALSELKPGVSTARDVRNRMGRLTTEWKDADGTLSWEYPRTPEGTVNYLIVIGPDGVLREVRQMLTEENFGKVGAGMTKDDVRRLLGQPTQERNSPLAGETVWHWKAKSDAGADCFFNVHFDADGQVLNTSSGFVAAA